MASDSPLDRLVPRHSLPNTLQIRWNTASKRGRFGRGKDLSTEGFLRDLSLTGALIEVDEDPPLAVGDQVEISLGEKRGTVVVRHVRPAEGTHGVMYGVEHLRVDDLRQQFEIVVAHLRGDEGQLQALWQQGD